MAIPSKNTWSLGQWYDQDVAGNVSYSAKDPKQMFGTGYNHYGQLGLNQGGPSARTSSPTLVGTTNTWYRAFDGSQTLSSAAIKVDGTLWSMGYNGYGQLGQNTGPSLYRSSPTQVGTNTTWDTVTAGERFYVATRTDGTAWAWGLNWQGQVGDNNTVHKSAPIQIGTDTNWKGVGAANVTAGGIKTDGTLWLWGEIGGANALNNTTNRSSPTQIGTDTDWADFHLTWYGGVATKTDGTLWTWGNNEVGELGQNNLVSYSSPIQIPGTYPTSGQWVCGQRTGTILINTDGELWMMGENNNGALGQNDLSKRSSPTQIPGTWTHVIGCDNSSMAVKSDGTLWAWGNNQGEGGGQLGLNSVQDKSSPTQVGTDTGWSGFGHGDTHFLMLKNA